MPPSSSDERGPPLAPRSPPGRTGRNVQSLAAPRCSPRRERVQRRRRVERAGLHGPLREAHPHLRHRGLKLHRRCLSGHRAPPRGGGDVLLLGPSRETDPPRAPCGGHVAATGPHGVPRVLSRTYGSAAVQRERSSVGLPPRRSRCSSGSPSARTGGTARSGSRSAGSVGVGAPLPRAGGNSTAAPSLRIISAETTRLHSAGRSGGRRVARLTRPAPKRPPSRLPTPLFRLRHRPHPAGVWRR
jgi:hypothetical protein